jgi:uncharacterized membrane protein YhhN
MAFALALACALVDWFAVVRKRRWLEFVFKPATMIAVITGAALLMSAARSGWLAWWFMFALLFSLVGDVLLMLPDERWFLPGLFSFLAAHGFYIVGLNRTLPPAPALLLIVPIAALNILLLGRIVAGVEHRGAGELRRPIIVYSMILSLTLFSGWATWFRPAWTSAGRGLASVGATFFFISDLMLAWNRFVERSHRLHSLVIITYHLAQFSLGAAVGWGGAG